MKRFQLVYADTGEKFMEVDSLSEAENELNNIAHSDHIYGLGDIDYEVEDHKTGYIYEYINGQGLWMTPINL